MSISNHWRNKQVQQNLLWQESKCLDFVTLHTGTQWSWHGKRGYFFDHCSKIIDINPQGHGTIIINTPVQVTIEQFVDKIDQLTRDIKVAYLAVNRFEFRTNGILRTDLPDDMEQCVDIIISRCEKTWQRLYRADNVDGKHFVGVHGLDVFVYEHS